MHRFDIINLLIKKFNYQTYLEIGIRDGDCFQKVICPNKTGVDPSPVWINENVHVKTSDDFFKTSEQTFDIIFIDGLHHTEQVDKDIYNSLEKINEGGCVVLHDTNPKFEHEALKQINYNGGWNGDVYLSIIKFKETNSLKYFTVDTDCGVTVIHQIKKPFIVTNKDLVEKLNWKYFDVNRKEILNLVSTQDFLANV